MLAVPTLDVPLVRYLFSKYDTSLTKCGQLKKWKKAGEAKDGLHPSIKTVGEMPFDGGGRFD